MSEEFITLTIEKQKNIALIAHDNKKAELIDWCNEHKEILKKHFLCGTGTTARMITDQTGLPVKGYNSGPLGGDQQIGAKIVEGKVDFVIFFSDPLTAQPHDPDVKALLRIAQVSRVADLFEARRPKEPAILAEISGIVSFGKETKGKRRLVITPVDGSDPYEEMIPKWRQLNVFEGERVERGDVISDGPEAPHDILRLRGVHAVTRYIVNEVQDVYRLQGVKINDKHIEVIVRQMLRKATIVNAGSSDFLEGEQVEYSRVKIANRELEANGKVGATYSRDLLGITKASLATESFISAASFQETTRVLTEAAVAGKRDELRGLKENVIVGRLIPAGTGYAYHQDRMRRRAAGEAPAAPQVTAEDASASLAELLNAGLGGSDNE